jgi:DNA replication protein DnaC
MSHAESAVTVPGSVNAAAYQKLRGHLAYLKLGAAIDALPGVLDAARDGQLSVLAALEQLMAAEAAATEARKLATRLHFAALPAPWTLGDYDYSAQPGADPALIGELATLRFIGDIGNQRYQNLLNDPLRETFAA